MNKRVGVVLPACFVLALLAGCGSSNKSSTGSSTKSSKVSASSGLKAETAPKYASPPASAPVKSGTVQIEYRDIAINPDTLKVKVGSTVKWTNFDNVDHNVTSEGGPQKFASKDFGENGTYEVKLTKPGVIHYECTIHPATMNGTIDVVK